MRQERQMLRASLRTPRGQAAACGGASQAASLCRRLHPTYKDGRRMRHIGSSGGVGQPVPEARSRGREKRSLGPQPRLRCKPVLRILPSDLGRSTAGLSGPFGFVLASCRPCPCRTCPSQPPATPDGKHDRTTTRRHGEDGRAGQGHPTNLFECGCTLRTRNYENYTP